MRAYETLLLFHPELTVDNIADIVANLTGILEKEGGKIVKTDDWGMRDLAYPVQKQFRGHYLRLEYDADGSSIGELERNIRITDGIMKFTTVKLSDIGQAGGEE